MSEGDDCARRTTVIQNIFAPVYGHIAGGDIHASVPKMPVHRLERRARPRPPTEIDQRDVLLMLEQLADPAPVLDFMAREFGTRVVMELESPQLYKLRWYIGVLISRAQ